MLYMFVLCVILDVIDLVIFLAICHVFRYKIIPVIISLHAKCKACVFFVAAIEYGIVAVVLVVVLVAIDVIMVCLSICVAVIICI